MKKYMPVIFALILAPVVFAAVVPIGGVLKIELAKYDPFPAEGGKIVTVWIKAENVGTETVKDARFALKADYPFSLPNNDPVRNYGGIGAGDDVLLEYKLFIDTNAPNGTHKMKIIYGSGDKITAEKEFEITVKEREKDADLEALLVKLDPEAYPGSDSRLTMDIVNRNPGTAYFTLVKAESPAAIIEKNEVYVGNLESDDFDSVDFDLRIKDVQPGEYPVNVTMTYKNKDSVVLEKKDIVTIKVVSENEAKQQLQTEPPVMNIIILIVVLLIAIRLAFPLFRWYTKPFRNRK